MKHFLPLILLVCICACKPKPVVQSNADPEPVAVKDAQSFARPDSAVVKHLELELKVDFDKQQLTGKAKWTIDNIRKGNEIILDVNSLYVQKVTLDDDEKETSFYLDSARPYMGQALHIKILPATTKLSVYYTTSKEATALQWLSPSQTAGKQWPFLFTQSESVYARTWIPCQDGPAIRFTYQATVVVPKELMAVMSAENPQTKTTDGIYFFKQTHPIPSYLMALAVGDIGFKAIDSRTGVYAETPVVEKAAWEFADMGKMVEAAEKLYGQYRWGRFDVIVLPPGFPYGGMENPNLTFLTPSVIAGDRSLVSVVAHELAHSWSGNLVTNATWNDFWLNEGFTTYFERRIVEALYGKPEAQMQEVLGRQTLMKVIAEKGDTSRDTKLKGEFDGRDSEDAMNELPYEKGYAFLRVLEEAVGREKFDGFLKNYFDKYAFQSRTTEQFLYDVKHELLANDTALEQKIRINEWIYKPGVPSNIVPVVSTNFNTMDSLIGTWQRTGSTAGFASQVTSTNQKLYFISHLPVDIAAGWLANPALASVRDSLLKQSPMATLDSIFHFTQSGNAEIQSAWYTLAVKNQYRQAYPSIEKFLVTIGRRKLIQPVYKEMIKTPQGKAWAKQVFEKAKSSYHPLAVQTIGNLVK